MCATVFWKYDPLAQPRFRFLLRQKPSVGLSNTQNVTVDEIMFHTEMSMNSFELPSLGQIHIQSWISI